MACPLFPCAWRGRAVAVFLAALPVGALAQAGPPLVTDDPGTPGDGHWEINLATTGERVAQRRDGDVFDADMNYGVGERIQLNLDIPWNYAHDSGGSWKSGLGASTVGVKWRFVDPEDAGFALSTYPKYQSAWLASSTHRGLASANAQLYVPFELAQKIGDYDVVAEVGHAFIEREPDQWRAGIVVAHGCGGDAECMVEVHQTWAPHDTRTLLNFGLHWKLSERAAALASAGHEFGPDSADRQRFVFYLGVQLQR